MQKRSSLRDHKHKRMSKAFSKKFEAYRLILLDLFTAKIIIYTFIFFVDT